MGFVITIAQGKGGSGKTTTSINLACAMRERGYKVVVADMDRDKPDAVNWANTGENENILKTIVTEVFDDNPMEKVEELKRHYDYVFLDTPPNFQTASIKAVMLSDFVILPTSDSMLDQIALTNAIAIPKMAKKPFALLANRIDKRTNASNALLLNIEKTNHSFKTFITSRKKMVESQFEGKWIGEYEPNGDNHQQYIQLSSELINKLKELTR